MKTKPAVTLGAILALTITFVPTARAQKSQANSNHIKHVLLVSVDGMHVVDYLNCSQ
jgi:hypothetical protein